MIARPTPEPDTSIDTKRPPALTLSPIERVAVHDGDTFRVTIPMHALIPGAVVGGWEEDVRLAHCNAAELRTPDGDNAASQVVKWFNDPSRQSLTLAVWGRDKYGRLLADVSAQDGLLSTFVLSLPGTVPL